MQRIFRHIDTDMQKYSERFVEQEKRMNRNGCFEVATLYERQTSPHLLTWFQTDDAMIMLLSNHTVQVGF